MYFKSLEVIGFKSFLNKTKLKFEPGVTAVVGPNGCGKSNIVDAIKWVLGEQSARSMRGEVMQDVIFSGTENHEPVNVAEVSLTLSNEDRIFPVDYDEITISRRLYRSGESEYLLNKTPVRLTDVRNLLMGTGIGTSSYSIVEQGRMDMILSSKPEERRYVFEEASGITRYKSKKREALLKLERTQENLVRINDIIREVERQINSIERRARKAERYKIRYEEFKELDVKLAYKKFKALNKDDISLGKDGDELKQRSETLRLQLEESSLFLTRLRGEYNGVFENLQRLQRERTQFLSDIDKNKRIVEVNGERVQELQSYVQRLDWEIEDVTERKEKLKSRLEILESRFLDISGKRRDKSNVLVRTEEEGKKTTANLEKYRHELKFNREKTVDMLSEQTKIKNKLIKINADIQNTELRRRRLKLERNGVQSEKDKVSEELKEITQSKEAVERELEDKKKRFALFNKEYMANQQKLVVLNDEKIEKEKRLNEITLRLQFLEKLLVEREGISGSVKDIMNHVEAGDPRFSGIHGILSEIVNLNEEYEESMKFVLGEAAHALVVDNRQTAESIIEYLRENSMESVNFIILEELKDGDNSCSSGREDLRDITCVLNASEPYASALRVLLGNILVFSKEDDRPPAEENKDSGRFIIGRSGEVRKKGFKRSRNYSERENIPLFGRREKIRHMKEEERRIREKIRELEEAIEETDGWIKTSSHEKETLELKLRQRQMDFADISSKRTAIKEKFNSFAEELLLLDAEIEDENNVVKQLYNEKETFNQTLEQLEGKNTELQNLIEKAQNYIHEDSGRREKLLFQIADIKAELSVFSKEEENLKENLERDHDTYRRMDGEIENKRIRITEAGEKIKTLNEEIRVLSEGTLECETFADLKSKEISEREECKEKLTEDIRLEEIKIRKKEKELETFRDKMRDVDIRKKELEYKRNALIEKMSDTYKVDITQLNIDFSEDMNWEEITERIVNLKQQLDKMGEVSLEAVEEHRQLEERYQFLNKQREDLVSSRESLMQAISKINRTTRKLFMETFESIKKEFNNYFRMLFAGGKTELILEDESNVLECGIDIVVRPPGKKLHNIMQLSGGEKAMTAIALIFAIFKVNPSPFCILDEIDAPLDESNIVRFCRVLQEFIKLSQFVIVTHNRMTIQLADVLYGITMEEKGVSKVVSVKFSEEKAADTETVPAGV